MHVKNKRTFVLTPVGETTSGRERPAYLKNQGSRGKRRTPGRRLFNLLFLLSIGLNVYFITFQNSGPDSISQSSEAASGTQIAMVPSPSLPVDLGIETPIEAPAPPPRIEPAGLAPAAPDGVTVLQIKIQDSLTHSLCRVLTREEGCEHMSAYLARQLVWFFDINRSMRNGDTLSVIYKKVSGDERIQVLKLVYESTLLQRKFDANFFREKENENGGFFDREGREIAKRIAEPFAPIKGYTEITSLPGDYRQGPVGHEGTDFKAPVGTDVFAAFSGQVTRINWNVAANGFCVEINHPANGVKTLYLHLSQVGVRPGENVKQGQKIGESGNTGRSFAPHLHFEIKDAKNRSIVHNPFEFPSVKSYYRKLARADRDPFQEIVRGYDSLLRKG